MGKRKKRRLIKRLESKAPLIPEKPTVLYMLSDAPAKGTLTDTDVDAIVLNVVKDRHPSLMIFMTTNFDVAVISVQVRRGYWSVIREALIHRGCRVDETVVSALSVAACKTVQAISTLVWRNRLW